VRAVRYLLLVLSLFAVLALTGPAGALASGCNNSAGDSQYIDPLAPCNGSGGGHHSGGSHTSTTPTTSTTPATTPTTTPTTSTPTTTATVASTSTSTTSGKAKDPKSKALPRTGLDLAPALIVAVAFLGGGLVLRRLASRPSA
jgi:hypothetical protein